MHCAVWILLKDGSILEGWLLRDQVKRMLNGMPLREGSTFKLVVHERHKISTGALLAVVDMLAQIA